MHGDASSPDNAVLTKEDYELYNVSRQAFTNIIESDLISKTFLFLGFSFTDPNIDYILGRIRALVGTGRDHYCIMRREPKGKRLTGKKLAEFEYSRRKQQLRIDDLGRYNIRTILVDEYSEITDILKELNRRVHLNDILVSGSAFDYEPRGRESIEKLSRQIGQELIKCGYNLISGFGLGLGSFVIVGAMEALYHDETTDTENRLVLRPFPQGDAPAGMSVQQFWERYRTDMISKAGFAIFLCGNKQNEKSETVLANGVMQEFEIAKQLGVYPIPVGATGHAAREIWNIVNANLDEYYPGFDVKTNFQIIVNERKSNDEINNSIFAIIKRVKQ
jgi:hypothetical protein